MSAPGGVVLAASAVVASPVLLLLHQGAISVEDALLRGGICLVLCRVGISVVASLAYSPPRPQPVAPSGTEASGAPAQDAQRPA